MFCTFLTLLNKADKYYSFCVVGSVGSQTLPKTLEDYLEEEYHNPFNKLEIKLVDPTSSEFKKTMSSAYKLYVKYQIHVHHDKEEDLSTEQFERFLVKSPLQVLLCHRILFVKYLYFVLLEIIKKKWALYWIWYLPSGFPHFY